MQIEKMPMDMRLFSSGIEPIEGSGEPRQEPPDYAQMMATMGAAMPTALPPPVMLEEPTELRLGKREMGAGEGYIQASQAQLNPTPVAPAIPLFNLGIVVLDDGSAIMSGEGVMLSRTDLAKVRHIVGRAIARSYREKARRIAGNYGPVFNEKRTRNTMQTSGRRRIRKVRAVSKRTAKETLSTQSET